VRLKEVLVKDFFMDGGWGMFPTLALGLFLVSVVVRSAVSDRSRGQELVVPLGVATITSGFLGFVLGLMATFNHIAEVGGNGVIAMAGAGESLNNLALAFGLVLVAAIATTIGRVLRPRPIEGRAAGF
jgi:hypothetical protein